MSLHTSRIALVIGMLVVVGSCTPLKPHGKSPLAPPQMSSDSVVLDIFFVRFPYGDESANGPLWDSIDEQHFPTEVRRELAAAGFRAGVVGGPIPEKLAELLELNDKPPPSENVPDTKLEDLAEVPMVVRRHKQLRTGRPCEIQASEVYEELPVVLCKSGELCGQSYEDAQAMLIIKATAKPSGRVQLELTPQIQHGRQRPHYVGTQGTLRMEIGRDRRTFDDLVMSANLAAGDMVVLGSIDGRPGSLGHYFFTQETEGRHEQKLLVVRLSQTQHDDLFDPNGVLPVDDLE